MPKAQEDVLVCFFFNSFGAEIVFQDKK